VNRAELIDQIRDRLGVDKKAAENAVDVVFDTIQRAVAAGEKVALTGFGVFEKVDRAARTGRNPRTGASVKIKKTSVPKFRPGTQFKGVVSGAVKLGKVADTATKAAAKSVGDSARSTARTAAAAPGKATAAARGAAKKTSTAPAKKTTAKAAAPAKSSANGAKKTAGATKSAANGAKKTAAKKAPAKKAAKR
jgi:DNA-binding protein HU-beta